MSKMKSIETLESWIDSYLNFEKTPKKNIFWLDTMKFFCTKFGQPQDSAPCFHVAGSKGKGSVSTLIASILDEAGYKTGIYTSPHILDFIERVSSANGAFDEDVYDKAVKELMEGVQNTKTSELPAERPITWFELVTLFSFLVFRQAKVDYSVYEVGLGGRLDSTNVVSPVCSIITPIELEHTEFLGDTLEKIAYEKGGIIKENTPVIIAKQRPEVRSVFEKIAKEKHAPAIFVEDVIENLSFDIKNISECIKNHTTQPAFITNKEIKCTQNHTISAIFSAFSLMNVSFTSRFFKTPIQTDMRLVGKFQAENAALAAIAVKTAIPSISEEAIERGLKKACLPARFEIITNPQGFNEIPYLILDGAHTVNSVRFTMETTRQVFGEKSADGRKRILLFACAADKDAQDIAPLFANEFDSVFLTKPGNVKQADMNALTKAFDKAGIPYDCSEDFESQIKKALAEASAGNALLLVTGSFYLIAEVKKFLSEFNQSM